MIRRWHAKAVLQGVLSLLPRSWWWNQMLQKAYGSLDVGQRLEPLAERTRGHLDRCARAPGTPVQGITVLELGTGAFPLFPLLLALAGADRIHTFDIVPLASRHRILEALTAIEDRSQRLEEVFRIIRPDRLARIPRLRESVARGTLGAREVLRELGVVYEVRDATDSGLEAGSIDLIASNDVLEHIPPDVLRCLMREFYRVAAPDGIMSHFINMRDHYHAFDAAVGPCNFYRYDENSWRWFNNDLHYQNRLRLSDYHDLLEDSGWTQVDGEVEYCNPEELERIWPLAPEFADRSDEDLRALELWCTCRKTKGGLHGA